MFFNLVLLLLTHGPALAEGNVGRFDLSFFNKDQLRSHSTANVRLNLATNSLPRVFDQPQPSVRFFPLLQSLPDDSVSVRTVRLATKAVQRFPEENMTCDRSARLSAYSTCDVSPFRDCWPPDDGRRITTSLLLRLSVPDVPCICRTTWAFVSCVGFQNASGVQRLAACLCCHLTESSLTAIQDPTDCAMFLLPFARHPTSRER